MPELPEVETIRRELEPLLSGRRIAGVTVGRPDIVGYPTAREFARKVPGHSIIELRRRGKYLIVALDRGRELVVHLRLSGHLLVVPGPQQVEYERVRFELSDKRALSFAEPRVLGRVYFVETGRYPKALAGMAKMGPEPIHREFDHDYLAARLRGRKAAVKSLLLDQSVCCGIGNIYSDEALFRARVKPSRPAGRLSDDEVRRLAAALRDVLNDGIKWCGTTMTDSRYRRPDGRAGSFQEHLAVFDREGEACRRRGCRGRVKRTRIGNRSSHFCPTCQK
jgi:formamidopyrimidine-DNA glycosylase